MLGASVAARVFVALMLPVTHGFALGGDVKLPPPYVSRALDAVLLPIDAQVRKAFKLSPRDSGVLVLSVQPGGVADRQQIAAGDVIAQIRGKKIVKPIDVDTVVYYWIKKGDDGFLIDYYRNGAIRNTTTTITLELYMLAIDVAAIATWEFWSTETSFSYSEFYSEYSSEMTESYTSSETTVEETATSEDFQAEIAAGEKTEDTDADGVPDAADPDDDNDGTPDGEDQDDDGDGQPDAGEADPASDDAGPAYTDGGADDAPAEDDGGADDAPAEDDGGDDSGGDDSGGADDGGGDDGGADDGGGDDGAE